MYQNPIDGDYNNGYHDDAYIVDFYGNIFYNEKAGAEFKMVSDEQFIKAEKDGFRGCRNLIEA